MDDKILNEIFYSEPYELEYHYTQGFKTTRSVFGNELYLYVPGMVHYDSNFLTTSNPFRFPAISITGRKCQLSCEHCKGKLLENMLSAETPQALVELCKEIKRRGGTGCLISGGSNLDGSVPLKGFIKAIKEVKNTQGIDIIVHTGILQPDTASELSKSGIDAVMVDIIGSDDTYEKVYHLSNGVEAIKSTLSILEANNMAFVPHIVAGLHYGTLKGEMAALEIISQYDPEAVVVVSLMPLENTPMENTIPPSPIDISRVILASRLYLPKKPILLGCAKSRGDKGAQIDVLAIKAGVNGIVYPSEDGYNYAIKRGLKPIINEHCCALIHRDISKKGDS